MIYVGLFMSEVRCTGDAPSEASLYDSNTPRLRYAKPPRKGLKRTADKRPMPSTLPDPLPQILKSRPDWASGVASTAGRKELIGHWVGAAIMNALGLPVGWMALFGGQDRHAASCARACSRVAADCPSASASLA